MIDTAADIIDLGWVRARRLERKARPMGIDVRVSGLRYALFGPDRGWYLYRAGAGPAVRWLTYDEANEALDHHLARPG